MWNDLRIGSPRFLDNEELGNAQIKVMKSTEDMMRVTVTVDDPKKVAEGAEDPQVVVYKGTYKWIEKFQTLVAVKCDPGKIQVPPPKVETKCETAVHVASNVVKVVVAGNIKDTKNAKFPLVAECIKTRTIETVSEETKVCMLDVLQEAF